MGVRPLRQLKTLRNRADWLKMRIQKSAFTDKNRPWDQGELQALEWALGILGPMFDKPMEVTDVADAARA